MGAYHTLGKLVIAMLDSLKMAFFSWSIEKVNATLTE